MYENQKAPPDVQRDSTQVLEHTKHVLKCNMQVQYSVTKWLSFLQILFITILFSFCNNLVVPPSLVH